MPSRTESHALTLPRATGRGSLEFADAVADLRRGLADVWASLLAIAAVALARLRRRRQAAAIRRELAELDDRMLRDLGFCRDEIASVAAEISRQAECTRLRVRRDLEGR